MRPELTAEEKVIGLAQVQQFMKANGLTRRVTRFPYEKLYKLCGGIPYLQVSTGIPPWPTLWFAVLFDGKKNTGYFALGQTRKELLSAIPTDMLLCEKRHPNDPKTPVEVWI